MLQKLLKTKKAIQSTAKIQDSALARAQSKVSGRIGYY